MSYFLRHETDGFVFPKYGPAHIVLLLVAALGVWLVWKYGGRGGYLRRVLFVTLLVTQILLYGWFFTGGGLWIVAGLPLYHCRISILAMLIALVCEKKTGRGGGLSRGLAIYLGTFGAPVALLIPIMEPFSFPHITNVSYFAGHILMIWTIVYMVKVERYPFDEKTLYQTLIAFNVMNLFILTIDHLLGMNYAYFLFSPVLTGFFGKFPYPLYALTAFAIYNGLIVLIHFVGKKVHASLSAERSRQRNSPEGLA